VSVGRTIEIVPARARRDEASAIGVVPAPPLSLYVHLPWCVRKCPYCDFNSFESPGEGVPEKRYLDALTADLERSLPDVWGRSVRSVFIGGGTPSLFAPESIDRLLAMIRARLPLLPGAEVTMEANPGTFEAQRFKAFAQAGVTRLSVGVQSFSDQALAALGRIHDGAQARRALEVAATHFSGFNVDLMYGLPGQSLADCGADLAEALAFEPPHLSYYHLTIEPGTAFATHPPAVAEDDLAADMQALIEERAGAAGLMRYEVSGYARRARRCEHNLNYWQFGDYLGIGAGAHGKISLPDRIVRDQRHRNPQRYMDTALAGDALEASRVLLRDDLVFEFMLNALRLVEGVPLAMFARHTGLDPAELAPELRLARAKGLLDQDRETLRATELGQRFLNDLQQIFLRATAL